MQDKSARRPSPLPISSSFLNNNETGQGIKKNPFIAKEIEAGTQNLGKPKSCFLKLEGPKWREIQNGIENSNTTIVITNIYWILLCYRCYPKYLPCINPQCWMLALVPAEKLLSNKLLMMQIKTPIMGFLIYNVAWSYKLQN